MSTSLRLPGSLGLRARRSVLALPAALFALVLAAGPASAYSYEYDVAKDATWQQAVNRDCNFRSLGVGGVCFDEVGDDFYVDDWAADGRSIGIQWKTDYGRYGLCRMKAGAAANIHICDKNMIENTFIKYRVGVCDVDWGNNCTRPAHYKWDGPASLPWTGWLLNDKG